MKLNRNELAKEVLLSLLSNSKLYEFQQDLIANKLITADEAIQRNIDKSFKYADAFLNIAWENLNYKSFNPQN